MRGRREGNIKKSLIIFIPALLIVILFGMSLRRDPLDIKKEIETMKNDENAYIQWSIGEEDINNINENYQTSKPSTNYLYGISIGGNEKGEYLYGETVLKDVNVQVFQEKFNSTITICFPFMDTDLSIKADELSSNVVSVTKEQANDLLIIKIKFKSLPDYRVEKEKHKFSIRFEASKNQGVISSKTNNGALILRKNNDITLKDITETNDTLNKQLTLLVDGEIDLNSLYYGNGYKYFIINEKGTIKVNQEIRNATSIFNIEASAINNKTSFVVTTDRLFEYIFSEDTDYIYIKPVKPREKYSKIVVIDPGHGGELWPGAVYKGILEKEVNLTFAMELKSLTDKQEDIKFYYLRTEDVDVTLDQRVAITNELLPDMFISMHCNANDYKYIKGTEVFFAAESLDEDGFNGKIMAEHIYNNLSQTLNSKGRGALETEEYRVVVKAKVPAVLIELGYMTNSEDLSRLSDLNFLKKAADTLYNTILELYNTYEID